MMRRLRGYQSDIKAKNRALEEQNEELQRAKETFEKLSPFMRTAFASRSTDTCTSRSLPSAISS